MYRRDMHGWFKHLDFMVIDILCLHFAFVMAYIVRFGTANPYVDFGYRNLVMPFTVADLLMIVFPGFFNGVLKRGIYKEFVITVHHVCFVAVFVSFYMFSVHISGNYSRIMYYTLVILYFILSYLTRLIWKRVLLKNLSEKKVPCFSSYPQRQRRRL